MQEQIEKLRHDLLDQVSQSNDLKVLDGVRVAALGKKGAVTGLMKQLGQVDADQRRALGAELNRLKDGLAEAIETRREALERAELDRRLAEERIDVTLPARPEVQGTVHPVSQVTNEIMAIFCELGFEVAEGRISRTTGTISAR